MPKELPSGISKIQSDKGPMWHIEPGTRFGNLVAIGRTDRPGYYTFSCDYNDTCINVTRQLARLIKGYLKGNTNGCDKCIKSRRLKSLTKYDIGTNQTYGFLKILDLIIGPINNNNQQYWIVQCTLCGDIDKRAVGNLIISNKDKPAACMKCTHKLKVMPNQLDPFVRKLNIKVSAYKCRAAKKSLPFLLTDDEVKALLLSPCCYCGLPIAMGMDRMNNDICLGYVTGNAVSCCKMCNYMKYTMNDTEFLLWVTSIKRRNRCDKLSVYDDGTDRRVLLRVYKHDAKRRGLVFALSDDEAVSMFGSECFYCKAAPSKVFKTKGTSFLYNGIDRIDNPRDYLTDNCVPCCTQCNIAKSDMPLEDFYTHSERIQKYQQSKQATCVQAAA